MLGPRLTRGRARASCAGVARGTSSGMRLASGSGPEDGLVVFGMVPEIYNWGSSPEGVWLVLSGDCEVRSPRTAKTNTKYPHCRVSRFVTSLVLLCQRWLLGARTQGGYGTPHATGRNSAPDSTLSDMRDCAWVCVRVCGACLPGRQGCP